MDYLKKSRIEEVLIAILGKGTVTSQLLSRIEKILDAIRVKGSYDGIVMSEVEEILVCILLGKRFEKPTHSRIAAMLKVKANGGEYTELRKSRVEDLIFEWINAVESATYTGTLPATLQTVEGYLESYKIYGNTVQNGTPTPENPIYPSECGEKTANLFSGEFSQFNNVGGTGSTYTYFYIPEDFTLTLIAKDTHTIPDNVFLGITKDGGQSTGGFTWVISRHWNVTEGDIFTVKSSTNGYHYVSMYQKTDSTLSWILEHYYIMLNSGSTALPYEPYGYKLPLTSNNTPVDIYIGDDTLSAEEYVDSTTGKIYRRTKNLSPPEEEWVDGQIGGGDGTVHPSTQIKVSPFIDVSTCETCIMEVFSAETEWAAAGYREMAFYDENKQYLGWIGGGGRQTLTPDSTEMLSEFPAGTVYVRIGCSHGDQPFYPQLVSGYTPTHQFYPYLVPTDPPAPFPQIPTVAGTTVIDYDGEPKPDKVELTYSKPK